MKGNPVAYSAYEMKHEFVEYRPYNLKVGEPLMVAQWLRYCATNRKVAGSIPDGVIGIFH
jgi:hypothetical protein